jgi:hypothetical protein
MESTSSTAPPAAANNPLQSLAVRDEGSNGAQQQSPTPEMTAGFKCTYCARWLRTLRGRARHEAVHKKKDRQMNQLIRKGQRQRLAPAGPPQVSVSSSSLPLVPGLLGSAYFSFHAQLFKSHYPAGRAAGGLAPDQLPTAANAYLGSGGRGQAGSLGIYNFPSLRCNSMPMFQSQTGSGTSGVAQPSLASGDHNGGTGGDQQDMRDVNQEETTDGIDLTLRL